MDNLEIQKEIVKLQENKKIKKIDKGFYIGILVTFIIDALITAVVIFYELGVLNQEWETQKWVILADGFTISGGFTCLFYLLSYLTGEGVFDAISYGFQLAFFTVFHKDLRETKLPKTYADYRDMKRSKNKNKDSVKFLLISGGFYLLIGIIFTFIHLFN